MLNSCIRCISFESYIKPQRFASLFHRAPVVYLLNPTSNHNEGENIGKWIRLYIFWILHQTKGEGGICSCANHNSSESGINACFVVYLLNPTSNHNLKSLTIIVASVVYLLNPTSNHNGPGLRIRWPRLYIFWILHQTTTAQNVVPCGRCCIYFESYIKPQLLKLSWIIGSVVYLLNPTLNHNFIWYINERSKVVYLLNPTSNHNVCPRSPTLAVLYIFWILHQTTTGVWSPLQQK